MQGYNTQIQANPTQVYDQMVHPVLKKVYLMMLVSVPVLLPLPGRHEWVVRHGLPRPLPHPHLFVRQEAPHEGRLHLLAVHLRADDDEFLSKKKRERWLPQRYTKELSLFS